MPTLTDGVLFGLVILVLDFLAWRFTSRKSDQTRLGFRALMFVDVPTLVVHGDADAVVSFDVTGKAAAALIKDSKLLVYAGAPHALYITHKEQLNQDLLDFVRS